MVSSPHQGENRPVKLHVPGPRLVAPLVFGLMVGLLLGQAACSGDDAAVPAPARPDRDGALADAEAPGGQDTNERAPAPSDATAPDGARDGDAAAGQGSDSSDAGAAAETRAADAPSAAADAPSDATSAGSSDAKGSEPPTAGLRLDSSGFLVVGSDLVFPKSASYPADESPPFTFVGVPATAKSLAMTFVDHSIGAVKWVLWDIPPQTRMLPANLSKTPHPSELPTSTQRGSLGRTGYSGPGVKGPPLHSYEFQLFVMGVDKLAGTDGADTVAIRAKLMAGALAKSPLLVAKGQLGGPTP
jgi:phosphatidylethanolamine-binding protein (PEBP) family uncharacterized protein